MAAAVVKMAIWNMLAMAADWKAVVEQVDIIMRMEVHKLLQDLAVLSDAEQTHHAMAVAVVAAGTEAEPTEAHRQYPHPTITMTQVVALAVRDMYILLRQQATTQADAS